MLTSSNFENHRNRRHFSSCIKSSMPCTSFFPQLLKCECEQRSSGAGMMMRREPKCTAGCQNARSCIKHATCSRRRWCFGVIKLIAARVFLCVDIYFSEPGQMVQAAVLDKWEFLFEAHGSTFRTAAIQCCHWSCLHQLTITVQIKPLGSKTVAQSVNSPLNKWRVII